VQFARPMTRRIRASSFGFMRNRRLRSWDVALALGGAAALIVEGRLRSSSAMAPSAYLLAIAAAAPLAWRTRAPLPALVGVETGAILCAAAFHASWSASALVAVQLFTVALLGHRQRSMVVGAITAIVAVVAIVLIDGSVELTGIGLRLLLVTVSLVLGDTVRSRRALRAAARERAQREAREREEEHRRRLADERLRIARELHDTLAHSLVAINVRAGVAADLADSQDPSPALRDIKEASATALRDLRDTLGLLRERDDAAPTAPALDLESLPGLIDNARAAGLRTDAEVEIDCAPVPPAIGRAAFRIVQEALTNVLRHAEASRALVRVGETAGVLTIEVTDNGRANGIPASPGHGLRGMAERATALGGSVDAGPRKRGGWRVSAELPLGGGAPR
jgi:signal transduction histidine kinase